MFQFWQDLRFGLRLLRRSPVFALTVSLLLGIGIGANTLIFSMVDTLLLRPLPVKHPEQLVRVIEVHPTGFVTCEFPSALCERDLICQGDLDVAFDSGVATERIRINSVSGNFFDSLGITAQLGRVLNAEDNQPGVLNAILSYDFWQKRMGGSASVVGTTIRLNGRAFTIVGVLARGVNGLNVDTSPDVRISKTAGLLLSKAPGMTEMQAAVEGHQYQLFMRLRPGISRERTEAEMEPRIQNGYRDALIRAWPEQAKAYDWGTPDTRIRLESAAQGVSTLRGQFSRGLGLLMASVALLLLMACGNVAGLLLARSAARSPEMNVRLALGASRWRIARQLLTESLVLAVFGGVLGVLLTYAGRPLLLAAIPPVRDRAAVLQPLAVHIDIDWRVLAFVMLATLMTALFCGLVPAMRDSRLGLAESLRGGRMATGRLLTRHLLVAVQVAICLLLLAGASVLVETFNQMRRMDAGFDRDRMVTFTIDPRLKAYTPERARILSEQLMDKTPSLPGVIAVANASHGVMRGTGLKMTFGMAGRPVRRDDFLNTSFHAVTPGYFDAMGMRLLAGRLTLPVDINQKPARMIVNEAFVRRFLPGQTAQSALGQRFGSRGKDGLAEPSDEIVGVVNDAKYRSLREPVPATIYGKLLTGLDSGFILHVRTKGEPSALIGPVRRMLRSLDPDLPIIETSTLRQDVEASLWQERLLAWFSTIFGCFAALLAGLGLYGALESAVTSRTREVGIRVALGADPLSVIRLLSGTTILLIAAGVSLGMGFYFAAAGWIRQLLYGVAAADPTALGWALLLVFVVAAAAIVPPVRRAVGIAPATALRHE